MCGRFTLRAPAEEVASFFGMADFPGFSPRYNIAPTQAVPAVRRGADDREFVFLRWGLVPFWSDGPTSKYSMINARAETVAEKPAFRAAFRRRRCLIPADGFYEWKKTGEKKQPWFIHRSDDRPFALAGLWEHWEGEGQTIDSCAIIVTDANERVEPIHDRMPVILKPEDFDRWLDPEAGEDSLKSLLRPHEVGEFDAHPVSRVVNSPKNDGPECVDPVDEERQRTLFDSV